MNPITRANNLRALLPSIYHFFGDAYDAYTKEYEEIFQIEKSKRAFEELVLNWGTAVAPQKAEGSFIQNDTFGEGYTQRINMQTYALGVIMTREAIDDNQYVDLTKRAATALGRSMAYAKEVAAANILNNAFSSAQPGADGQPLASTSHPLQGPGGGTYSNRLAVFADLSETSLETMVTNIRGLVDERNMLIRVLPKKLIIPKEQAFVAARILGSKYRPGTADNDINVLNNQSIFSEGYMVNHYLTDPNAFFIQTDVPDSLMFYQRQNVELNMNNSDFRTGNLYVQATERYGIYFANPRGIYAAPGS